METRQRRKHRPGLHDQSSHGRRVPKGRDLLASGQLDVAELADLVREGSSRTGAGGYFDSGPDDALAAIARQQGFDRPPKVVSRAQLDKRIAAGDVELFRGVAAFGEMSAGEMAEQFRSGPAYYGHGEDGSGIYATANQDRAARYGVDDGVLRMALAADARTVTIEELTRLRFERRQAHDRDKDDNLVFSDLGRLAAALGYDAIAPDDDPRSPWILLNRGAVTVEKANSPAKSLKHLPGQHNQDSHGNGVSVLGAIPGIPVYDADKYADLYGSVIDDAGIDLGNDAEELPLVARYFESGDMHVALHLEDGKVQVLEEMDPESMRQLAYDLEAVAGVDETEFEGGDVYDIIADAESESHGWYVAKDGVGDVRLRPPDAADEDYLEFSSESATEFVNALLDMADSYEEHFSGDAKSHRRARVKRNYVRDDDGQFAEVPGSGAGAVVDKLRGAGRIDLEPGERLLRSDRTRGNNGRAWLAVVEKDGKRSLRIGLGNAEFGTRRDSNGPWRAAEDRSYEINEERQELIERREDLESEIEELDADPNADPAGLAARRAQLEELHEADTDEVSPNGHTAILDEQGARRLRETLARALDDGEKLRSAFDPNQEEIDRLEARRDKLRHMDRKWTDEEDAEWDRLTAELGRLEAEQEAASGPDRPERGYWVLAEGSIPGQWADVHYEVFLDDPTVGVETKLGAIPHHYDQDFTDFTGEGMHAEFSMSEADEFVRLLAKLNGDEAKAATRHPHTTRSRDMLTLRAPLKNAQPGMAFKSFDAAIKAVDDTGTATIVIATLNEVDKDGDVTLPGFFGKQHTQMVPVHDWNHVPIGKGVVYESGNQVLADVKFNLSIQAAKDWHSAIDFDFKNPPALQQYSYGYTVKEGGSERGSFKGQSVRFLKGLPDGTPGVDVHEVSPVLVGAGNGTRTAAVKAHIRPARPARFTDEAHAVLASVQALSARAADVMAMRQAKGKRFGADSAGLLAQIEAELKQLQELLATEPDAPADVLEQVLLNSIARKYR